MLKSKPKRLFRYPHNIETYTFSKNRLPRSEPRDCHLPRNQFSFIPKVKSEIQEDIRVQDASTAQRETIIDQLSSVQAPFSHKSVFGLTNLKTVTAIRSFLAQASKAVLRKLVTHRNLD